MANKLYIRVLLTLIYLMSMFRDGLFICLIKQFVIKEIIKLETFYRFTIGFYFFFRETKNNQMFWI